MARYIIEGGHKLGGSLKVQGSKNSSLPILAAAFATGRPCVIHNCPDLSDIASTVKILRSLGCEVHRSVNSVSVDSSQIGSTGISDCLMQELRSSIIFMGALISLKGEAELAAPGGCDIGLRPFDLHLNALRKLGVSVSECDGRIRCRCRKTKGTRINLSFPSVGATENIILASLRCVGTTTIINAAREPEIVDLARFLNSCGARISGAGEGTIQIEGVENLHSARYTVMPDRIVACTYLSAAAITGSELILEDVAPAHIASVISCYEQMGCSFEFAGSKMRIVSPERLNSPETIRTMPYPGFPTDCQAITMSLTAIACGTTLINENIFENRFRHVAQLNKMGAKISVHDRLAVVNGVHELRGASVDATDLRAGAALVVAGLRAEGVTEVKNIHYIDRGYDRLAQCLSQIGTVIKRTD